MSNAVDKSVPIVGFFVCFIGGFVLPPLWIVAYLWLETIFESDESNDGK